jgi:hypothetical protein
LLEVVVEEFVWIVLGCVEMLWGERRGSGSFVAGSKLTGVPDAAVERLEQIARRSGSG